MKRRRLLQCAALLPVAPRIMASGSTHASMTEAARIRPGDPGWPAASEWERLRQRVSGNLIAIRPPLEACRSSPGSAACQELFHGLKNPYFIGDSPALTQTCGWAGAWTAQPSVYAVAARETAHVVAAVDFARENNLRLVVKAAGTPISAPRTPRIRC